MLESHHVNVNEGRLYDDDDGIDVADEDEICPRKCSRETRDVIFVSRLGRGSVKFLARSSLYRLSSQVQNELQ